jgi:solute carrier family 25 aspartate/glutamate transporter 12/13
LPSQQHKIKREQYALLFQVADRKRVGRVTLQDWSNFENLLEQPDAEYHIAFRLFDREGTGYVKFEDFKNIYDQNKSINCLPFDWNSEWAKLYVGGRNKRHDMTYPQFSQMMRGLQGERVRQGFQYLDTDGDGYIEPEEFQRIIMETARHKLSDHLLENLHTLCNISVGSKISYANVRAFQNMIREMDLVELIIRNATHKSRDGKITRSDFLNEASRITRFSLFTPMEADILFHFAGMDEPSGRLGLMDFAKVLDASWQNAYSLTSDAASEAIDISQTVLVPTHGLLHGVLESIHHFALGSLAGAFGAFMVYPIDLVKTRMQNQRSGRVGELMYKNSIECARKVVKNEGIRGLYSGVWPQMVGVAPEKAIKLTVNDLMRGYFMDKKTKSIWWGYEMLAGGAAGGCQVIFTNPLEIVKIRLQVQGEMSGTTSAPKRSALWIVRNLGLLGLYKGASACLLRDSKSFPFPRHVMNKADKHCSSLLRHLFPLLRPPEKGLLW